MSTLALGKRDPSHEEPDVSEVRFAGGGTARGRSIRIPAVWDEGFVDRYLDPLIRAFASELDGNPNVYYIMPGLGHIENLNCQPSKDGSRAVLESGWTPEKWAAYCDHMIASYQKHFKKTPLLVKAAGQFLRDRAHDNYSVECGAYVEKLSGKGVSVIRFGLEGDAARMDDLYAHLKLLLPAARSGKIRIGLGDDWPLWVPEHRRGKGPTSSHDAENLKKTLENAFITPDGLAEIPTTILFCQMPELLASHPDHPDFEEDVQHYLENARKRMAAWEAFYE